MGTLSDRRKRVETADGLSREPRRYSKSDRSDGRTAVSFRFKIGELYGV